MSLLSILKNPEIRGRFKETFVMPAFGLKGDLLAPPLTKRYGLVGSAFDYAVRFWLERRYRKKVETTPWVAEWAYYNLLWAIEDAEALQKGEEFSYLLVVPDGSSRFLTYERDFLSVSMLNLALTEFRDCSRRRMNSLRTAIIEKFGKSRKCYRGYLKTGHFSDELIEACLFLARLDSVRRPGMVDWEMLHAEDPKDVEDLRQLLDLWSQTQLKIERRAYLNPTFGKGSELVGGADADLIADDTLIDFKVTQRLRPTRDHFNQVIGYYLLSLIGGVNDDESIRPIKRIGLYFARHGKFWIVPVSQLAGKEEMADFKEWFQEYVQDLQW